MNSAGTSLNFLMRDGAIRVTFTPTLTPAQYSELHSMVAGAESKEALEKDILTAAKRWQVRVFCETY